jgi:hypothetical protein
LFDERKPERVVAGGTRETRDKRVTSFMGDLREGRNHGQFLSAQHQQYIFEIGRKHISH